MAGCSKSSNEDIQKSVDEISVQSQSISFSADDDDGEAKKYAAIICTENNKIGTECSLIGENCKYYECNANTQEHISDSATANEIQEYATRHAESLASKGLIDPSYAPEIINMLTAALNKN